MLQTLVDEAFMWSQTKDSSILPVSQEDLCQPGQVLTLTALTLTGIDRIILTDLCRQGHEILLEGQLAKSGLIPSYPALPDSALHGLLLRLHCPSRVKGRQIYYEISNINLIILLCFTENC